MHRRLSPPLRRPFRPAAAALALAAALVACERPGPPEPGLHLRQVGFDDLPGWRADSVAAALPALARSCGKLLRAGEAAAVGPQAVGGTVADWRAPCAAVADVPAGDDAALRRTLERHFTPFRVAEGGEAEGLFTGYYEPTLDGARERAGRYRHPLYRAPGDLVRVDLGRFRADLEGRRITGRLADGALVPYHSRAEIEAGALAGRGLELVWVDDPVDAFFLHVQGSGRVELAGGGTLRVGYAASNGRPFTAIGRLMLERGLVERASMQAIRDWLRAHPGRARALMAENARYIFFRPVEGPGPVGAQGVALTAGRSLAVDPARLPLGAPVWLDTTWPGGERPLRRLMVAQDAGSAIKGAVRGDVFFGAGEAALEHAGRMQQRGRAYLLLPRAVAERRRPAS